jgi:hypothetical protein
MAKTALTELQQQIEEVRREAFAAGYAAAMQGVREFASRPVADDESAGSRRRGGARRRRPTAPTPSATAAARQRRAGARNGASKRGRSTVGRPERGANAQRVEEILKSAVPRALRMAEIRKALQEKGAEISFTSVRHALSQLEARNAAEQVGASKTWRHRGGAS